jgi:hypothetical protein
MADKVVIFNQGVDQIEAIPTKASANYAQEPFSGTGTKTFSFTQEMDELVISNDGGTDLQVNVHGYKYLVRGGEIFQEQFAPFTEVTIGTKSSYRGYAKGVGGTPSTPLEWFLIPRANPDFHTSTTLGIKSSEIIAHKDFTITELAIRVQNKIPVKWEIWETDRVTHKVVGSQLATGTFATSITDLEDFATADLSATPFTFEAGKSYALFADVQNGSYPWFVWNRDYLNFPNLIDNEFYKVTGDSYNPTGTNGSMVITTGLVANRFNTDKDGYTYDFRMVVS